MMHRMAWLAWLALLGGTVNAAPWDMLRPVSDTAVQNDILTRLLVFLLSLGVLFIAWKAYNANQSKRLRWVMVAFALFAVKWLLKVIDYFVSPGNFFNDPSENVFELLILGSLFKALFTK